MDRKKFIKNSLMGVAGLYALNSSAKFMGKKNSRKETEHHPIIIIGSGYGGAVAALRLCQAGKKVLMLEMGMDWSSLDEPFSSMMKPGKSAAWLKRKTIAPFLNVFPLKPYTGVLDRLDYDHIKVWLGRGVGGGSLVNGGMAVRPKEDYFKEVFPDLDAQPFFDKYFPLAEEELKVNLPSEDFLVDCPYYKFSRVGEKEAVKAGFKTARIPNVYNFEYMEREYRKEVPRSALAGEVIYGNNYGKNSLDKTYLKQALATGNLTIWDLHQVKEIKKEASGTYVLNVNQIDTSGNQVTKKYLSCSKLVLAAGTMGTLKLLLRSQANNNLQLNKEVGKNWGNNGNFMTGRNFVQAFSGGTGTKQSTIPVGAIDNWEDSKHPFFTEIAPLPMKMDVATSLYLIINRVDKKGSVGYDAKKDKLELDWGKKHTAQMKKNAKYFLRKMNKANGGTRSRLLFHNGYGHDVCYHPLGGAVLGKATDQKGRLQGHDHLFVIDGSLIPGTIGGNPFLTITALAEYCMEALLDEKAFEIEEKGKSENSTKS